MDDLTKGHVRRLCGYLQDERRDYESRGYKPKDHIWRSVRAVQNWLTENHPLNDSTPF